MGKRRFIWIILIELLLLVCIYCYCQSLVSSHKNERVMDTSINIVIEDKYEEEVSRHSDKSFGVDSTFNPMDWWDYDAMFTQGDNVYGEYMLFNGTFRVNIEKSELYHQRENWMDEANFISTGLNDKIVVYENKEKKEYTAQEFLGKYSVFPDGIMLLMVQMTIENMDAETAPEFYKSRPEEQDLILVEEILRLASSKIIEDRGDKYQYERYIDYFSEACRGMQYGTYTLQIHKGETKQITVGFWLDQRGGIEESIENIGYSLCFHEPETRRTLVYYYDPLLGEKDD